MDWVAIFEAVLKVIQDCQEKNETKLLKRLRRPESGDDLGFERKLRKALGYGPVEWIAVGRGVMQQLREQRDEMSDADLKVFIKKAKAA